MSEICRVPFIRLVLPLLFGIALQSKFRIFHFDALYIAFPVLILLVALFFTGLHLSWRFRWIWGLIFFALIFIFGCRLVQSKKSESELPLGKRSAMSILVWDNPVERANSPRFEGLVRAFSDEEGKIIACREHIFVYMNKSEASQGLQAGDLISLTATLNPVVVQQNPDEFDYRTYLLRREIFASVFVNGNEIQIDRADGLSFYRKYPLMVQQYACNTFEKAGLSGDEFALAAAITVGAKQYLDQDLRRAYTSSGAVHLLAVSGLHVGIIFVILNFLFAFLDKGVRRKIIKNLIIIAVLWFYAAIAGLAPSIMRASFMFSIFAVGDMFGKPRNTYNNIAFSCFVLCVVNPWCIFEIGFQLSYAAVTGIVFFQPKIERLIYIRNKFLSKIWELACVSIAAQLATLPVILYIFKQFPLYFVFANVVLVPLLPFMMSGALSLLCLSWCPPLLDFAGSILAYGLKFMNFSVRFCESLPGSVVQGIYIDARQCALLVTAVLALAAYWSFRKTATLYVFLTSLIGIFAIRATHIYQCNNQQIFGMFGVKRAAYAYFIEGRSGFCLRDSLSIEKKFDFNTANYLIRRGFKSELDLKTFSLDAANAPDLYEGVILFADKSFGLSSRLRFNPKYEGEPFALDYLWIIDASRIAPEALLSCYLPKFIIVSDNLPTYRNEAWIAIAEKRNIPYHTIKTEGAWYVEK
jgi:competence protein ComEC